MLFFKKKKEAIVLNAPCNGKIVQLDKLSDIAFNLLGVGCAVNVDKFKGKIDIYSPIDGELVTVFPTKHAYGIKTNDGVEVLIHIGIDTVNLNGAGFDSPCKQGTKIKQGQLLATVDLDLLKSKKVQSDVILVITDETHKEAKIKFLADANNVEVNKPLFEI